jgi:hypothetical protein
VQYATLLIPPADGATRVRRARSGALQRRPSARAALEGLGEGAEGRAARLAVTAGLQRDMSALGGAGGQPEARAYLALADGDAAAALRLFEQDLAWEARAVGPPQPPPMLLPPPQPPPQPPRPPPPLRRAALTRAAEAGHAALPRDAAARGGRDAAPCGVGAAAPQFTFDVKSQGDPRAPAHLSARGEKARARARARAAAEVAAGLYSLVQGLFCHAARAGTARRWNGARH